MVICGLAGHIKHMNCLTRQQVLNEPKEPNK